MAFLGILAAHRKLVMPGADCSNAIDQGEGRVAAALERLFDIKNYFAAPAEMGEV
jgi:hypothetical protein